jgi:hypothetical protein
MLLFHFPEQPPSPEQRERVAKIVVLLALLIGIVLALQYTRYALLTPARTGTLWGVLSGLIFGFLLLDAAWKIAERRMARSGTRAD